FILSLWLDKVPSLTSIFIQLSLVGVLIDSISGPLMTLVQATGKIKVYQIIIGVVIFLNLPINYFLLGIIQNPIVVFYSIIIINLLAFIIRLFFIKLIPGFNLKLFLKNYVSRIFIVSVFVFGIVLFGYWSGFKSES